MGAGALFGFVELDALRAVTFLGPCHAARLASSCSALSLALSFPCLRTGAAALATSSSSSPALGTAGLLQAQVLREALQTTAPELLAGGEAGAEGGRPGAPGRWLALLAPGGTDALFCAAARDVRLAAAAAVWAAALQRPGLAAALRRMVGPEEELPPLLRRMLAMRSRSDQQQDEDDFFEAIFDGNIATVVLRLACGADVEATGPRMHQGDVGCCKWTPLAAAADISSRRKQGFALTSLLLSARAHVDRACPGPCGWTPLMRAAAAGSGAADTLRLLVAARADVRLRAENGSTALEMGDKAAARVIREARDARAHSSVEVPSSSKRKAQSPNLLALANAGRGKAAGRGTRKS